MKTGLYSITNTVTGDSYVGASVDIPRRISSHKSHFRLGKHPNRHLQTHADEYGIDQFEFKTLLLCDRHNLDMYEDIFLKSGLFGYNVVTDSKTSLLSHHEIRVNHLNATTSPRFRQVRSDEMRKRIKTSEGAMQLRNAQLKACSQESREKIRSTHKVLAQTDDRKAHLFQIKGMGGAARARKYAKPIRCVELDSVFSSNVEAARHLIATGVTCNPRADTNILSAAIGKSPRAYGFHWEFVSTSHQCEIPNIFTKKEPA